MPTPPTSYTRTTNDENRVNWMPDFAMHKTPGAPIKAEGEEIRMQAAKSDHHHKSWRFGNRSAR